jgi:peptidoglycan/xylan/chitin deacetylase (PgdA/CDA1 family)
LSNQNLPAQIKQDRASRSRVTDVRDVKRKVKFAVSCMTFVMILISRLLRRIAGWPDPDRLVILYYHAVPAEWRANFAKQLDTLISRCELVTADYAGRRCPGPPRVAITFDDAFESVLENAVPELLARRIPATIFIPCGVLGSPPKWDMEEGCEHCGEVVAGAAALRSVASDLIRFGAHSLTHPHLPSLPLEEAQREIQECRGEMLRLLGVDTSVFSFPYGEYDATVVELCRKAGYQWVFSNVPVIIDPTSSDFVRGRVMIEASDGAVEFYLKVTGACSWMPYFSKVKKLLCVRRAAAIASSLAAGLMPQLARSVKGASPAAAPKDTASANCDIRERTKVRATHSIWHERRLGAGCKGP